MTKRVTHWLVDHNTGMAPCGSGPGALPAQEGEAVTCKRCRTLLIAASKEEVHHRTVLAAALLSFGRLRLVT